MLDFQYNFQFIVQFSRKHAFSSLFHIPFKYSLQLYSKIGKMFRYLNGIKVASEIILKAIKEIIKLYKLHKEDYMD